MLTLLVTIGGIGLATAASCLWRHPLIVMVIWHTLVRRGLMKPLHMKTEGTTPARPATWAGQDAARR